MTLDSNSLARHYESFLGPIDVGWTRDFEGNSIPFQVARFSTPVVGGIACATLGLSGHLLKSRRSGRDFRQELLILVPPDVCDGPVPAILQDLGKEMLASGYGLLRGDVIGPRGPLFPDSTLEALYAAMPVYLPDSFAVAETSAGTVVITWLVPISHSEAHLVFNDGWSAFEKKLVESDPDLVDISRGSVV